ncbi:MAG TPA: MYXO-CTERM sorting domain-containing protein [Myxococcales bacterium]|jgi:MYXO-CTERM domain-containing protein
MGRLLRPAGAVLAALALLFSAAPSLAGTDGSIGLAWDPPRPEDPHVDGWFLYWGTTSGGPYPNKSPPIVNDGTSTPGYTMGGLTDCTMYYFVATAFTYVAEDDAGAILESTFSNEAWGWPRPTVTAITPATAVQQASISMAIEGTNFNTTWGTPTVSFDDPAMVAGEASIPDCYHLSVPVDVNCARTGPIEVTVTNPEATLAKSASMFSVTASGGCVPPDAGAAEPPDASTPGPDAAEPGLDAAAQPGADAAAAGEDASSQPPGPDAASQFADAALASEDAAAGLDAQGIEASDAAAALADASSQPPDSGEGAPDGSPPDRPDGSATTFADTGFHPSTVESGCGCSTAASPLNAIALLAAGLLLGRKRRRPCG